MALLSNGDAAVDSPAADMTATTTTTTTTAATSSPKRKRDHGGGGEEDGPRVRRIQNDILHVLQSHDTEPSLLNHAVAVGEPSHKKAKLSDPTSDSSTIATKLRNSSYASLHDLRKDAAKVSDDLVTAIRAKVRKRADDVGGRPTVEELKMINKIQSLNALVQEIVKQESRYEDSNAAKQEVDEATNGHDTAVTEHARAGTVLTLFGNAPGAKQLFSSLQHAPDRKTSLIKTELPVEEMSLPNGISTTRIMSAAIDDSKPGPTFDQAFAPPYSLAPLQPPKSHKRSATRDQTVTWEFKDPTQRNRRGGYTVQPLSTGAWLGYGGLDEPDAPTQREKRKQRDRALSSSDGTARRGQSTTTEETLRRHEEALFRRAYSSFAPAKDNSSALVSEESKNMVWWGKVGEKRYNETFAIDPALLDGADSRQSPLMELTDELKVEEFDRVLEHLDEFEAIEDAPPVQPVKDKTDVEQVLREVSELLETLASHQRIRNVSLPSSAAASRTPISPGPVVTSHIGKPDEPSEQETTTYHSLRRELAYLLLKLPPYAVAKLDGDQLADLGVKSLVPYQVKNVEGAMAEDLVTRQVKLAAMATANSIANLARPNSSTSGQRYNQTPQGTPAIGAAAHTRYGSAYNGRPSSAATPSYQRQQSNPASYGINSTARATYTPQPQQYGRPAANQPGYGPGVSQQYYNQQRSVQQTPGGFTFNQQYQQTPVQNQQYGRGQTPGGYPTHNLSQQPAYNRNVSPAKPGFPLPQPNAVRPMYSAAPQQPQQQQQPGSGRATPVNYPSNPHTPVGNGYPPPARPVQGLAPRPSSATPQPPHHTGPTQPQPQHIVTNGNS